jgi:hypothetical protein
MKICPTIKVDLVDDNIISLKIAAIETMTMTSPLNPS